MDPKHIVTAVTLYKEIINKILIHGEFSIYPFTVRFKDGYFVVSRVLYTDRLAGNKIDSSTCSPFEFKSEFIEQFLIPIIAERELEMLKAGVFNQLDS